MRQSSEPFKLIPSPRKGLVTGIGFIGGGTILKLHEAREIEGLTTAAGIWMSAAVGAAAGLGRVGLAVISVSLTWLILALAGKLEVLVRPEHAAKDERTQAGTEKRS